MHAALARSFFAAASLGLLAPWSHAIDEPADPPVAASPLPTSPIDRTQGSIQRCVEFLLSVQEGEDKAEWPYEGVYRVRGKIPIGYRIGGTAIAATALLRAPGYADDAQRHAAVARAAGFVADSLDDPLMSPDYEGGYDVRGWGYTYALHFLLALKGDAVKALLPADMSDKLDERINWCIDAIQQTEIPEAGGWNYSRPRGKGMVAPSSPFMTGPTLQALFTARQLGFKVDDAVVERGLKSLERGRASSGAVAYAGEPGKRADGIPGAVGRMLITEITLLLAGGERSDLSRVRGALDSFLVHWEWLDQRRAKPGTHEGPYGVAPYYFYYAHAQAAEAIELLPKAERAEYRRRLHERLYSVQLENGVWNDRVFERTANYGTSQALMCLLGPDRPPLARWEVAKGE